MIGNDRLLGQAGNDTLNGGLGNDELIGGAGMDVFQLKNTVNEGSDLIYDYVDGTDRIQVTNTGGTYGYSNLTIVDTVGDCRITLASDTVMTLQGVAAASMDASDFIFRPADLRWCRS